MIPQTQIAAAMAQLVQAREDLMVDECTVTRSGTVGQTPQLDPDTLQPTTPAGAPIYAGPCTVADPSQGQRGRTGTLLDEAGVPSARILKLPNDSAGLLPGDVVEVTGSAFSPGLVGDRFVIVGEDERSYATFRRYVLRGSSWLTS